MKQKIKKQIEEHKVIYFCLFLALLLFTAGFFYNRYAVDTYYLEGYGYRNNAFHPYFQDGRLFMTLFLGILGKLQVPFAIGKIFSWLLAFLSLYFSILIFYHLFLQHYKKSKFLSAFLSFFFVLNVFFVEFFMFPEYTGIMCFSIFLISMATKMMVTYFQSRQKKYLAFAVIFSFFTAFCYQGTLSLLVLFPIVFTLYYGKNMKTFIQNNLVIALCYLVSSITTLTTSKLLGSTRTSSGFHFSLAISKIYDGAKNLLSTTFGILPNYMFVAFTFFFSILIIYLLICQKEKFSKYLFFAYVMIAVMIVTLAPHFLVDVNSIWVVPRSNIGLGLLVVMPLVIYFLYVSKNKNITFMFVIFFLFLAVFQLQGWQKLLDNQIKVNILDQYVAMEIVKEIDSYESQENKITQIAICNRDSIKYQYDGTLAYGDMNIRAMAADWSVSSLVSTYLGRNLTTVKSSDEMNEKCRKKKDEEMDFEKNFTFFQKDTVYICSY